RGELLESHPATMANIRSPATTPSGLFSVKLVPSPVAVYGVPAPRKEIGMAASSRSSGRRHRHRAGRHGDVDTGGDRGGVELKVARADADAALKHAGRATGQDAEERRRTRRR